MARFKNHLLVVVGFAIAGMIGAAFGTGTAQAIVSTLVSVVNPATSPVPTRDVDQPARNPYRSSCNALFDGSGLAQCNFTAVPANMELVIQTVSVKGNGTPAVQGANVGVNTVSVFVPVLPQGDFWGNTLAVTLYGDPGNTPVCSSGGGTPNDFFDCAISGYLVSLP